MKEFISFRMLNIASVFESSCSACAVSSNLHCEDRLAVHSIGTGDQSEHYYAVFDGHGGWECADFAHTILSESISSCLHSAAQVRILCLLC